MSEGVAPFLVPIVALITTFSFAAVAVWVRGSRKERESYYNNETLRKLAEMPGNTAESILAFVREEARIESKRRLEGRKLGGIVAIAVGIALGIFLKGVDRNEPAYLLGLIPFLVGVALLLHSYGMTEKD